MSSVISFFFLFPFFVSLFSFRQCGAKLERRGASKTPKVPTYQLAGACSVSIAVDLGCGGLGASGMGVRTVRSTEYGAFRSVVN